MNAKNWTNLKTLAAALFGVVEDDQSRTPLPTGRDDRGI